MLADEGFVEVAILVAPRALLVIVELETIFISFVARLISIPIRKPEALSSDPFPGAFSIPIARANPDALVRTGASISVAEELLSVLIRDSRQASMVGFAYALCGIPVHLFGMEFIEVFAVRWRGWEGWRNSRSTGRGGDGSASGDRRLRLRACSGVRMRYFAWSLSGDRLRLRARSGVWVRYFARSGSSCGRGRRSGPRLRSARTPPRIAFPHGVAGLAAAVPRGSLRARLADNSVGTRAHEEPVLGVGIADVGHGLADSGQSLATLAFLPR